MKFLKDLTRNLSRRPQGPAHARLGVEELESRVVLSTTGNAWPNPQLVTLSFVPKLAGVALVIVVSGHWMLGQLIAFTQQLFELLPHLLSGG